jgi:hypothetical protein
VAVALTLVQTKQIRINMHKRNNTKHSKYQYMYYQNTHTNTHPHITKQVKTATVQAKTQNKINPNEIFTIQSSTFIIQGVSKN